MARSSGIERRGVEVWCVISDVHWPETHQATWNAFRKWHSVWKPNHTIVAGDGLDLPSLSTFTPDPEKEERALPGITGWVKELNALKKEAAKLTLIEGNHEERWFRKIIAPAIRQTYGLAGFSIEEQLRFQGLDQHIAYCVEDHTWTGIRCGQFLIRHGHRQSGRFGAKHIAYNLLIKAAGMHSEIIGHHHQVQLHVQSSRMGRSRIGLTNGHMQTDQAWNGRGSWTRGFTILELDLNNDWATPHPIVIEDGRFAYAGRLYDGNDPDTVVTRAQEMRISWRGRTWSLNQLAKEYGIHHRTLSCRLQSGMDLRDALYTPVKKAG